MERQYNEHYNQNDAMKNIHDCKIIKASNTNVSMLKEHRI